MNIKIMFSTGKEIELTARELRELCEQYPQIQQPPQITYTPPYQPWPWTAPYPWFQNPIITC